MLKSLYPNFETIRQSKKLDVLEKSFSSESKKYLPLQKISPNNLDIVMHASRFCIMYKSQDKIIHLSPKMLIDPKFTQYQTLCSQPRFP